MNVRMWCLDTYIIIMMKNSIDVDSEHECLPSFYWFPKLHKTPYGTRFIAPSNKCTSKRLSSLLTSCFKTILIHYKQYCEEYIHILE